MTTIKIEGLAELEARLRALPKKLQGRALGAAFRAGAREIQKDIKARAPVDTGALKRNVVTKRGVAKFDGGLVARQIIGVRHGKVRTTPQTFRTRNGAIKSRKLSAYDRKGQDPFYFRFVETGYHAVGRRKAANRGERRARKASAKTYGRWVPGQRFMREGLRSAGPRALVVIQGRLAREIERLT